MQWLLDNPVYLWLVVVIIAVIFEAVTYALVSVWFVGGGLVAMLSALLGISMFAQVLVFLIFSVMFLVMARPLIKKKQQTNVRTNVDSYIGKVGIVTKESTSFTPGQGKVGGQIWTIASGDASPLYMGEEFVVESVSGVKLIVNKIEREGM